jgi:hypothetical protein
MKRISAARDGSAARRSASERPRIARRGSVARLLTHHYRVTDSGMTDVLRLKRCRDNVLVGITTSVARQIGEEVGFVDPDLPSGTVDLQITGPIQRRTVCVDTLA